MTLLASLISKTTGHSSFEMRFSPVVIRRTTGRCGPSCEQSLRDSGVRGLMIHSLFYC